MFANRSPIPFAASASHAVIFEKRLVKNDEANELDSVVVEAVELETAMRF